MKITDNLHYLMKSDYIQDLINNNNWDDLLPIIVASYGYFSPEILQMCVILRALEKSGTPIEFTDINNKLLYLEKLVLNKDCTFTGMTINYGNRKIIEPNQIVAGKIKGINYSLSNIDSAFCSKQELFNNICWEVEVYNVPISVSSAYPIPVADVMGNLIKLCIDLD